MSANLDQDRVRWPGSGSSVNINTVPFGYYLNESCVGAETTFVNDCSSSAMWAAKRLGYPIVDIEMIDVNFYACFEESVLEYNRVINEFNIVNNLVSLVGLPQSKYNNLTGLGMKSTGLPFVVQLSKQYGAEALVGGEYEVKRNYIAITGSASATNTNQVYDLNTLIGRNIEHLTGSRIEVKRVFHQRPPAIARIYDPFSMTGMSYSNVLNEMGFAGYSPATQFLMTPIFEDLLRMQAIEFNDLVRKSGYSFELVNNKVKIFPIPTYDYKMYFEYLLVKDRDSQGIYNSGSFYNASGSYVSSNTIGDYSNVPYNNIPYSGINSVGKQWIRKYFLALCKELLGSIRQKYQTIPIPGAEVTLDGAELRQEASAEKTDLITQLRENLEATGRKAQMEMREAESQQLQSTLQRVPLGIYIG